MKFPALETVQILLLFAWGASSFRLTVLHTNDLHSRFDLVTSSGSECRSPNRKNCYGGVARLKYAVEQIKKQHETELAALRSNQEAELRQLKNRHERDEARLRSRHADELRREQQKESAKAS